MRQPVNTSSMTRHDYSNGGFVLHRIMVGTIKHSAWFSADGTMLDAEMRTKANHSRGIPKNTPKWKALAKIGKSNVN